MDSRNRLPLICVVVLSLVLAILASVAFTVKPMAAENEEKNTVALDASLLTSTPSYLSRTATAAAVYQSNKVSLLETSSPANEPSEADLSYESLSESLSDEPLSDAESSVPSKASVPDSKKEMLLSVYLNDRSYSPLPSEIPEETAEESSAAEEESQTADVTYDETYSEDTASYDTSYDMSSDDTSYTEETSAETSSDTWTADSSYDTYAEDTSSAESSAADTSASESSASDTSASDTSSADTSASDTSSGEASSESSAESSGTASEETSSESSASDTSSSGSSSDTSSGSSSSSSASSETSSGTTEGYTDLDYLAAICQIEAGSNYEGDVAVANVVLNRLHDGRFGSSIYEVIFAPYQFASGSVYTYLENGYVSANAYKGAQDALNGYNNVGSYLYFNSAAWTDASQYGTEGVDYVIIGGNVFHN